MPGRPLSFLRRTGEGVRPAKSFVLILIFLVTLVFTGRAAHVYSPWSRSFSARSRHCWVRLSSICFTAMSRMLFARSSHLRALAPYRSEDSVTQGNAGQRQSFLARIFVVMEVPI